MLYCTCYKSLIFFPPAEHSTSLEDVDKFIEALKKRIVSMCVLGGGVKKNKNK